MLFSYKAPSSKYIDIINKFVIHGISDKIFELYHTGLYGNINSTNTKLVGYYVIKVYSESYTLHDDTTRDRKISIAGEPVVKAK